MGYFTWTDAKYETLKTNRYGTYQRKYVVEYDKYAKLICPDDTEIETNSHDTYGTINGLDIYELVVDWNKEDLVRLLMEQKDYSDSKKLKVIAEMYVNGCTNEKITAFISEHPNDYEPYLRTDWKRSIGIQIACYDEDMDKLKYPIKLTKDRDIHGYKNLYTSYVTQ